MNIVRLPDSSTTQASAIYAEYPRKVGRPVAIRAILKAIRSYGYEFVLSRTRLYAEARADQDQQFTPYPATWFNQERFNDDESTWRSSVKPITATLNANVLHITIKEELERVEAAMRSIRYSYESHQNWTEADIAQFKKLKEQKQELRGKLGL